MNTVNFIKTGIFLLALAVPGHALQTPEEHGRESAPAVEPVRPPAVGKRHATTRVRPGRPIVKPPKPTPATAALSLSITPLDGTVNLQGREYQARNGFVLLDRLPAGTHNVSVRRPGYKDKEIEVRLRPGDHTPLSVTLDRLTGFISVSPLVDDAEIKIVEVATRKSVGVYYGRVHGLELPPGRYQVFVSKEGYRTTEREVVIESALKASIEPPLSPLPEPAPVGRRPAPPPFRPDHSTRAQTGVEGKYVLVTLTGRSGDTSNALGAVEVTLSVGGGQAYATNVSGMLTGYPCQVDFVRLENVAEYSFVEPPGAANQWARAVVRLRPKESKRPVRFLINWRGFRTDPP
jgi:hypothetical protein